MDIELFKRLPKDTKLIIKYEDINELRNKIVEREELIHTDNLFGRPLYCLIIQGNTYNLAYDFIDAFVFLYELNKDKYNQLCLGKSF